MSKKSPAYIIPLPTWQNLLSCRNDSMSRFRRSQRLTTATQRDQRCLLNFKTVSQTSEQARWSGFPEPGNSFPRSKPPRRKLAQNCNSWPLKGLLKIPGLGLFLHLPFAMICDDIFNVKGTIPQPCNHDRSR